MVMLPIVITFSGLAILSYLPVPLAVGGALLIGGVVTGVLYSHLNDVIAFFVYLDKYQRVPNLAVPALTSPLVSTALYNVLEQLKVKMVDQRPSPALQQDLVEGFINTISFPIFILNKDLGILFENEVADALFGHQEPGTNFAQIIRSPKVLDAIDDAFVKGVRSSHKYHQQTGVEVVVNVHVAPFLVCGCLKDDIIHEYPSVIIMVENITDHYRAEKMRVDFIANVSHEIKTPLTALRGVVETITGSAHHDEVAKERFMRIIGQQVGRLNALVGDLLSLSLIELTEHTPPTDPVSIYDVTQNVCSALEWRADARNNRFNIEMDASLPMVLGKESEIERLLSNLIENAIKYGYADSVIHIRSYLHTRPRQLPGWMGGKGPALAVAVIDQGTGFPDVHRIRLTERFYRIDAARSSKIEGTGLGLAIIKHIVQHHRGALVIESVVGKGSTFTVYFPVYGNETSE